MSSTEFFWVILSGIILESFMSICSLLVYRNKIDFFLMFTLCPVTFLNSHISSRYMYVCVWSPWDFLHGKPFHLQIGTFSFLPSILYFLSFSCLISLVRVFNIILGENDDTFLPCSWSSRGKIQSFTVVSYRIFFLNQAVGFVFFFLYRCSLSWKESSPLFKFFWEFLKIFWIGIKLFSSDAFSAWIDMIMWFFFVSLGTWMHWPVFWILNQPCILVINPS